jgi:hypothetical protein
LSEPGCLKCGVLIGPEDGDHCDSCEVEVLRARVAELEGRPGGIDPKEYVCGFCNADSPASEADALAHAAICPCHPAVIEAALLRAQLDALSAASPPPKTCASPLCDVPLGAKFYSDAKFVIDGTQLKGDICLGCRKKYPAT